MKETVIKYFLNNEEVTKECIDWSRTMTILLKGKEPNTAHISYRDEPKKGISTRAKASDVCPNGISEKEVPGCGSTTFNIKLDSEFMGQNILDLGGQEVFSNTAWLNEIEEGQKQLNQLVKDFGGIPLEIKIPQHIEDQWEKDKQTLQKNYGEVRTNESCEPCDVKLSYIGKIEGVKETEGKLDYELDWNFLTQMAERMSTNKGKYPPYNWQKKMDVEKLKQAMFRHVLEVMNGNYEDDGRLFGHIEAISCNAMLINYQLKNNK